MQIQDHIIHQIETGVIQKGDKLPSINQIADNNNLAKETVVKALASLKRKGIVESVHGKGFFIISTEIQQDHKIFLLFDTLTAYKEDLFHSIKDAFSKTAVIDIYFHHFNIEVFENLVTNHLGKFTDYLILPIDHPDIARILDLIPYQNLYLIDRFPKSMNCQYKGVFQNFQQDIYNSLKSTKRKARNYEKLYFIFRNTITDPPEELIDGFKKFVTEEEIDSEILRNLPQHKIEKGSAYLIIDDEDLVSLVIYARANNLKLGTELGIISYNDTSLKKVVGSGISTISTDFQKMGEQVVQLIQSKDDSCISNPCGFIDRGSF